MGMTSTLPPARWHHNDTLRGIMYMLIAVNMFPFMNIMVKVLSTDTPPCNWCGRGILGISSSSVCCFCRAVCRCSSPAGRSRKSAGRSAVRVNHLFFFGLNYISVPTASMINFTAPLIATVLAIPLLGEKVGPRRLLAVAGLIGAAIILRPGGDEAHWAMFVGWPRRPVMPVINC